MNVKLPARKGDYRTREQLYALCVLLQWPEGLNMAVANTPVTVNLLGVQKGNTGLSVYLLEQNPNATNVQYDDVASLPFQEIYFKVLDVDLCVTFDEDGVGVVSFPIMPVAEYV